MDYLSEEALYERAQKVKCLVCDIDGVLTNGNIFIGNDGNDMKVFNAHDGCGMQMLMAAGIRLAVITSSENSVIHHRMEQIGVDLYFTGQVDKRNAYSKLKEQLQLNDGDFAYIGDDLADLLIIRQVGLGVTVPNAVRQVKEEAHWMTENRGGEGAVRELCDIILTAQGKFDLALGCFFSANGGIKL